MLAGRIYLLATCSRLDVNMLKGSFLTDSSLTADTHHESMACFTCWARIICCKPSRSFCRCQQLPSIQAHKAALLDALSSSCRPALPASIASQNFI